ncbi:hypothetical protein PQX77_021372 [Marasmius sp. AFHP31]|nr:hypothetical protein PQX77_021372 [Marasmius sp. AFHP31]
MSSKPNGRRTIGGGNASSEGSFLPWDGDAFATSLNEKVNDVRDAISKTPKFAPLVATDLANFLSQPVIANDLAAHEGARKAFRVAVEYVTLVTSKLKNFSLPDSFHKVQNFASLVQRTANNLEKEKADKDKGNNPRKRRSGKEVKSKETIEDSGDSEVEVIDKGGDVNMADGINSSIWAKGQIDVDGLSNIKKGAITRASTKKGAITRASTAIYYLSKARGKLPAFKKARFEPNFSNLQNETAEEVQERLSEAQQVARFTALVPFLNLETLESPTYLSIANFLKSELNTLAHATRYYGGQYTFVQKQLEEVNRIHLSKLGLNNAGTAEDANASVPETVASASGSSNN